MFTSSILRWDFYSLSFSSLDQQTNSQTKHPTNGTNFVFLPAWVCIELNCTLLFPIIYYLCVCVLLRRLLFAVFFLLFSFRSFLFFLTLHHSSTIFFALVRAAMSTHSMRFHFSTINWLFFFSSYNFVSRLLSVDSIQNSEAYSRRKNSQHL